MVISSWYYNKVKTISPYAQYFPSPNSDYGAWDFILGTPSWSISQLRRDHLRSLVSLQDDLTISLHDPKTGAWTKWLRFYGGFKTDDVACAYDIHRQVLDNEIVIESDYPDYEMNWDAARLIGAVIESRGFKPMYYFSGGKSIHIHVFIDFQAFLDIPAFMQDDIVATFKYKSRFVKSFMEWVRNLFITSWGTNARKFDTAFIKAKHLVRMELSRNKNGFKTFLGYTYKDLSPIPQVCNERNRIKPSIGAIELSRPNDFTEMVEEFLSKHKFLKIDKKHRRRDQSLHSFFAEAEGAEEKLPACVEYILSSDFGLVGDGFQRASFILANELKRFFGQDAAMELIKEWNERMGCPVRDPELEYRILSTKEYTMTCDYVHKFLEELGIKKYRGFCTRKVFKSAQA